MSCKDDLEYHFSKRANNYLEGFGGSLGREYLNSLEKSIVLDRLQEMEGLILDIGCGPGRFSVPLSSRNKIVSLDISIDMLQQIKKKSDCYCVKGDGQNLPFKQKCFDAILSIRQLKYTDNYYKELEEISRCAKKNCRFILEVPNIFSVAVFYRLFGRKLHKLFIPKKIIANSENIGFEIEERISLHFLPDFMFLYSNNTYWISFLAFIEKIL
ncbi:methyltransferase domain-containing protein, partial [bacterium]|nr:methyltransferase domain-containing protein [bacterium]